MNKFIQNAYKKNNPLITIVFLVAVSLLIRLLYFFILITKNPEGVLTFDSYPYIQLGKNIWEQHVFSRLQNSPYYAEHIRVPLYPLIIGLFGNKLLNIIIFQIVLCGLNTYLIIAICKQLKITIKITILVSLLYSISINSCLQSTTILTEIFCESLVLSAMLCLAIYLNKNSILYLIFCSLLFGLALFTKPIFLWIIPVLVFVLMVRSKKIKMGLLLLFPLIIYTGWSFRNFKIFNKFFYANIDIQNLAFFRAAEIDAYFNNLSLDINQQLIRTITVEKLKSEFKMVHEYDTPIFYNQLRSDAIDKITSHPFVFLKLNLINSIKLIFNPCNKILNYQFDKHQMQLELKNKDLNWKEKINVFFKSINTIDYLILLLSLLGSFICMLAIFAAFYFLFTKNNLIVIAYSVLILTLFVLSIGPESDARLRYILEPIAIVIVGKLFNDHVLNKWLKNVV